MAQQQGLGKMVAEEMEHILKYTGFDAGERIEPGSKLKSQLERIERFVNQVEEARALIAGYRKEYRSDMIRITVSRASDHSGQ